MKKRGRGGEGFGDAREKSKNRLNKHCALPVGQGRGGGIWDLRRGPESLDYEQSLWEDSINIDEASLS